MPDPKGPIGDCRFFRYATMAQERKKELESRTWGAGCIIHHDYPVSVPKFPASCSLPRPVSPDKVYVIGASPQHKLDFQIDDSGEQAHLMKLTVNAPNESAALFLKTDKPTIWHFSWTKDTQISAVIISGGKYKQAVSGLPEDVPVPHQPSKGPRARQETSLMTSFNQNTIKHKSGLLNLAEAKQTEIGTAKSHVSRTIRNKGLRLLKEAGLPIIHQPLPGKKRLRRE
ncbi:hypothetical protein LJB99_05340 [Deltaproteobacteria bacterium OttesenSCG-928-K17]|nr:hypothetical protein [Deltaproteobacteria bacterium OttesenSCG-928-K17]